MKNKVILVIDDNELNMKLSAVILESENYSVLKAYDAIEGIKMALNCKPDLILMDIQLHDIDGLTATEILKRDPALKNKPIIAFTSYAMEEDKQKAMDAGCDDYISKPIDRKKFLEIIAKHIN